MGRKMRMEHIIIVEIQPSQSNQQMCLVPLPPVQRPSNNSPHPFPLITWIFSLFRSAGEKHAHTSAQADRAYVETKTTGKTSESWRAVPSAKSAGCAGADDGSEMKNAWRRM